MATTHMIFCPVNYNLCFYLFTCIFRIQITKIMIGVPNKDIVKSPPTPAKI